MATTTRNDWLEADLRDDESEAGYDSEAAEDSRTFRASKRRKLSFDEDDESDGSLNDAEGVIPDGKQIVPATSFGSPISQRERPIEKSTPQDLSQPPIRSISKKLLKQQKKTKKSGVIYLSRIPPFMKPSTIKSYLQPFGEINRVFLTPEDPVEHTRRVKAGGNKKRSFVDGWVEFVSKRDAKACAETLNTQIIGGKKGSWYHDDIWNIKYLTGFKWDNLIEQIKNETAERAARLRTEIAQSRKENRRYVENVEMAKMIAGVKRSRENRATEDPQRPSSTEEIQQDMSEDAKYVKKQREQIFKQNRVKRKAGGSDEEPDDAAKSVLRKIF